MKKPLDKAEAANETSSSPLDLSIIATLAEIAGQHDLSEVEIEHHGLRVRVARERAAPTVTSFVAPVPVAAPAAPSASAAQSSAAPAAEHPGAVKSPMVGTVYRRASPETKPFVDLGSVVKAGDKLLLVEAMKVFNEIVAPRAGKVVEIFVEDATPVEYGQPLLVIE